VFENIENKIKEIAGKIYNSNQSDQDEIYKNAKKIYELAIIYKFLSKSKQNADWVLYSEKLKETLRQLDLSSEKNQELPYNESEIIPLIDSIKDLVTEIPETDDDK
jgi:Fe-S cluster assembly scaffold protein SufB